MAIIIKILPELESRKMNVKMVYAAYPKLFALQPDDFRKRSSRPKDLA
jgi:hypothetical protein